MKPLRCRHLLESIYMARGKVGKFTANASPLTPTSAPRRSVGLYKPEFRQRLLGRLPRSIQGIWTMVERGGMIFVKQGVIWRKKILIAMGWEWRACGKDRTNCRSSDGKVRGQYDILDRSVLLLLLGWVAWPRTEEGWVDFKRGDGSHEGKKMVETTDIQRSIVFISSTCFVSLWRRFCGSFTPIDSSSTCYCHEVLRFALASVHCGSWQEAAWFEDCFKTSR